MKLNLVLYSASLPDGRDHIYKSPQTVIKSIVDLRELDSLVEDQLQLGSCVGNALTNCYELMVKKQCPTEFVELSKLFVYYNARNMEGTVSEDVGATIRDGLKGLKKYGVCAETLWPYRISMFDDKPSQDCYDDALKRKIISYQRLVTIEDSLSALSNDNPVIIGMTLYDSFMNLDKQNSVVQMPQPNEVPAGDHAMLLVGYDMSKQQFLAKNSFGKLWGDNGYCWIPFEYATTEMFEQWIIEIACE